ncbi:MAG: exonuclease SbcCD subunit D [Gloeomargarita sp. SKYG116]|nr:exonuclease SbcCD subunit D [Gloeomargarita sp. SKYG116]MDW8401306.1 exonuclease SbcCD subunit D [Gloeomargarita sp. SKYGB_i_bin116]
MGIRILHLSDIHLGSGQGYGRFNPQTGINTRVEDFYRALETAIDQALALPVDVVLFTGDAFPDATPPPWIQELFARQFLRLTTAEIPVVMLVGNHDQYKQGEGGASLSIYRALNVPGVIVGESLATYTLTTPNGPLQIVTLPWITHSMLLTKPETQGLSMEQINQLLLTRLREALEGEILHLDANIPAILAAHLMVDQAILGAERFLSPGKTFTVPLSLLAQPCFRYVALGHVHRHQVLYQEPPVVYAGSIERVDFGEENEAKGYVLVEIEPTETRWQFCPLPTRPMHTIQVDLTQAKDPQTKLLDAVKKAPITDAIVRVIYRIRADQVTQINERELREVLATAHYVALQPEIVTEQPRKRVTNVDLSQVLDPMTVLAQYVDEMEHLKPLKKDLLLAAQALLQGTEPDWSATPATEQLPLQLGEITPVSKR